MTTDTITPATGRVAALRKAGLLRAVLTADAVVTAANGAVYLALGSVIDGPLGLPAALLHGTGAFLLLYAAAVGFVATRPVVPRAGAWASVVLNVAWALDSALVLALGSYSPTTVGSVWIALQAVVVAGFAMLASLALCRR
jgi:hypothetical protein